MVASVTGPAASAGVRTGDVLFAIGNVDLYSQDDLDDVLRASRPGDEVVPALKRGKSEVRQVGVVLGAGPTRATAGISTPARTGVSWIRFDGDAELSARDYDAWVLTLYARATF